MGLRIHELDIPNRTPIDYIESKADPVIDLPYGSMIRLYMHMPNYISIEHTPYKMFRVGLTYFNCQRIGKEK